MKEIIFVTGNKRKLFQANGSLERFGIKVIPKDVDIIEIQSHDPIEISVAKVRAAYEKIQKPLVICDHFWAIKALKGFPGGYMKDMNHWFEAEDFLALMKGKKDRSMTLTEEVIYFDGVKTRNFFTEHTAIMLNEARGVGDAVCERITVIEGQSKTIAQNVDEGLHSRSINSTAWQKFGEWYSKQQ